VSGIDLGRILLWAYVVAFGGYCLIVLVGALLRPRPGRVVGAGEPLSLGIVVPAFNERRHEGHIRSTIAAARELDVPIVVVDDGSTDGSTEVLEHLCGEAGARLLKQVPNQGKSAALNAGIAALGTALVLTVDADTTLETAGVREAAAAFADPAVGAVALTVDGTGASRVARAQVVEYRYLLNFEREALGRFGVVFTVPGSASLWRRTALEQIGGFTTRTCAEDTDATICLSLAGWKIEIAPDVRAITECPLTVGALIRQRSRWIWGTIQAAAFAAMQIVRERPSRQAWPAMVFVAVTALNIFGFLLSLAILWRWVGGALGWSEIYAAGLLFVTGFLRLALAYWKERHTGGNIFKILLRLAGVQLANTLAFWHGLVTGRAFRVSW
jgi:cellulose synthase/poly-beta-1,6-N-acetylglucosamine synthase-like glycosyltransferase